MVIGPVLALQPEPYTSTPAFIFYAAVYVYLINVVLFAVISGGLICLRLSNRVRWAEKSAIKNRFLSMTAASTMFILALFPLILTWVPDPAVPALVRTSGLVPWYGPTTFAVCLIALAILYWAGLRAYIAIRSAREGKTLVVRREPKFKMESGGHLTQILEIVTLEWVRVRNVGLRLSEIDNTHFKQTDPAPRPTAPLPPHELASSHRPFGGRIPLAMGKAASELHGQSSVSSAIVTPNQRG